MGSLFVLIGIVVFFFAALAVSNRIQRRKGNTRERQTQPPLINLQKSNKGCCGMHEVCEKNSLIAAFKEEPEYFDDEELDRFRLRTSDSYTQLEVEEFREVFYTVIDEEKPRWVRSLHLREIAIPDQMKDEIIFIVNDLRKSEKRV